MKKDLKKQQRRDKIRRRIRSTIRGTAEKPRMCIYKSNNHVYAQLVDDIEANTLVTASTQQDDIAKDLSKTKAAKEVGSELAKKALTKKISKVVFDRSGYKYHGIVKAFAKGAREEGLEF